MRRAAVLILLALMTAAGSLSVALRVPPVRFDREVERARVYALLLDDIGGPDIVAEVDARTLRQWVSADDLTVVEGLDPSTARDFIARNREARALPKLRLAFRILWHDETSFEAAGGWRGFRARHPLDAEPGAVLYEFSAIGFSTDGRQALVEVGELTDPDGGWGHYVLLERTASGWETVAYVESWIA